MRYRVIDRKSGFEILEVVWGLGFLEFLYQPGWFSAFFRYLFLKNRFFTWFFGWWHKRWWSRLKIARFIELHKINVQEFQQELDSFKSFNDFFIRKLKEESRPIHAAQNTAVMPADARYLFYEKISDFDGFKIKGRAFNLREFLQNNLLFEAFRNGSMVIARLCPSDYHRFHLSVDGVVKKSELLTGHYYSVNPLSLKQKLNVLSENKRFITEIDSVEFGKVLHISIGATCVSSVQFTYTPGGFYSKGTELGYFEMGASCVVLLFKEGRIKLDPKLVHYTKNHTEVYALYGEVLGTSCS